MCTDTVLPLLSPHAQEHLDTLHQRFIDAQPFRHIVIDDFLEPAFARTLLETFPGFEQGNYIGDDGRPGGKSVFENIRQLGGAWKTLDTFIQSSAFLEWAGQLTGIDDLLYDPFYLGGGTHENRHNQSLSAHIDFNYHPSERWHRRLNLIIYLNPEWQASWGGNLQLFRDPYTHARPDHSIVPLFNRCVIFETTEHSWHAFDTIRLPEDKQHWMRRSIALYFYSQQRPAHETAGRHTTHYIDAAIPEHWQAGHVLDEHDAQLLQALVSHRDNRLRELYAENARLLQAQDHGLTGKLLYLAKRLYVRTRR